MGCRMYGDWSKAGVVLKRLATQLNPFARAKLDSCGNLILERMKGHINSQDLAWTPLANSTVKKKNGNNTIYVETGTLRDGLVVRKIKSSKDNLVIFVGASPWKRHSPSGLKMSDLMIYMEYGTETQPPRPLVEPTYEEMKDRILQEFGVEIKSFVGGA